jgi:hypothetical protein
MSPRKMSQAKRDAITKRLAAIEKKFSGRLTPEAVVEDASNENSPLHELFEWDDSVAAHQFRLHQARMVITSVEVEVRTDTSTLSVAYYTRDPDCSGGEQGYRSITKLRGEEDASRRALIDAFTIAGGHLSRARHLAVALNLENEVERLVEGVVNLRKLVSEQPPQKM